MRITHSNARTYSVHFKSLFSFEIPWQALCLATAFLIISVMQSSAQTAQEPVNSSTTAVQFDIGNAIQTLAEQFCKEGDEVDLMQCNVPLEAYGFDPRRTVGEARAWTMNELLRTNAEETATQARVQVLRMQIVEEELRAELLQLQQDNGAVYSADEFAQAMAGLESLDHGLMAIEDELAITNDYTSELSNRLQAVEENNTLYLTVHNWCVAHADTDLCQALGFPE